MSDGKLRQYNGNTATKWVQNTAFLGHTVHWKARGPIFKSGTWLELVPIVIGTTVVLTTTLGATVTFLCRENAPKVMKKGASGQGGVWTILRPGHDGLPDRDQPAKRTTSVELLCGGTPGVQGEGPLHYPRPLLKAVSWTPRIHREKWFYF